MVARPNHVPADFLKVQLLDSKMLNCEIGDLLGLLWGKDMDELGAFFGPSALAEDLAFRTEPAVLWVSPDFKDKITDELGTIITE